MTTTVTTPAADDQAVLWHNLPSDEVCRRLDVDPAVGLSDAEVTERRARYGSNKLAEEAKEPAWKAFLRQYRDLMQLVLVGAARRQHRRPAGRLDGAGRARADRAQRGDGPAPGGQGGRERRRAPPDADHDGAACSATARASRSPPRSSCPGDIVGFEAGDKVPADGRVLVAATLEIEEAGLTGESTPVAKVIDPVTGDDVAARRPHRHGVHELAGDPRPRRDGRDGDGDVDRGRPHLRDVERGRAGEDAAHQAARPAHGADHDHGGRRAGADRRPRARPRRGLRHAVPRRHQPGDRGDPDRPARPW